MEKEDKWILKFSLYNPETELTTSVEKHFDLWVNGSEIDTLFQELRQCVAALGFTEKTLDEYFGEF